MKVLLTFDVEVWCNGWENLDQKFSASYERYVYGRSPKGDWALPKTLEILNRHNLQGVFFVEPLFAARFGLSYLENIVALIQNAGQEVQLHLHPEWTDEISPAIIADNQHKRQHMCYYTLEEQTQLIAYAKQLLLQAGVKEISAFRAGSYAANRDTLIALEKNQIFIDSSLNHFYSVSGDDLRGEFDLHFANKINGIAEYPISIFRDGFGKEKPAQIAGCSFSELRSAILGAYKIGYKEFVIVSHNFELLKPGSAEPDAIMVRRFEQLCSFIAQQNILTTGSFSQPSTNIGRINCLPTAPLFATVRRYAEQLLRRF